LILMPTVIIFKNFLKSWGNKRMRTISYATVVDAVKKLCIQAACNLPPDVIQSLEYAVIKEQSPSAKIILDQCIKNAQIASSEPLPICQDTGFAVFFVSLGSEIFIKGGQITDAINEGVCCGYKDAYLRKSIVSDPLFERKNTQDNSPAITHINIVSGDKLSITLLPKGGGSENLSALRMFKPSDEKSSIIDFVVTTVVNGGGNPCPPVIVGVGIGGTADKASCIAKEALLRPAGTPNPHPGYAELENEILQKINSSGVGPQGLGGTVSALAVHIEYFPCHIASLPVAVNLNCHAARKATIVL